VKILSFFVVAVGLASSLSAKAEVPGYWKSALFYGMQGNYKCVPTSCVESNPVHPSVNCKNLREIVFAYGRFTEGKTTGYLWMSYDPDGPTVEDWEFRREYTIDGNFDASGFTSTGIFKTPEMGSNGRVALKSMKIEMLMPEGAKAHASIDLGGNSPVQMELNCCTPDEECNPTSRSREFHNPPNLCPSAPKEAHDECEKNNRS
jgi:hypothetical protein